MRDTALEFTDLEIAMWSSTTQAIAKIADAHFDLFNEVESGKLKKRMTNRGRKALGTLYRAAAYLRATCNPSESAYQATYQN